MIDPEANLPICPECGNEMMAWQPCWNGCDEGYFDAYEEDPVNFVQGEEFEPCNICHGVGGWRACGVCNPDAEL